MITEDYVSFETAKLLKENGFDDNYTNAFFDKTGRLYFIDLLSDLSDHPDNDTDIAASTLYMAMKWLREVHGLYIEIRITNHSISSLVNVIKYYWVVFGTENAKWETESTVYTVKAFDKYEEAAEAGIKHCLENLI